MNNNFYTRFKYLDVTVDLKLYNKPYNGGNIYHIDRLCNNVLMLQQSMEAKKYFANISIMIRQYYTRLR